MAVKERLHQRHIAQDSTCTICGASRETIIHTLFECKAAAVIWSHNDLACCFVDAPTNTFTARWLWLVKKLKTKDLLSVATLLWAAWFCRNKMVYEQISPDAVKVAAGFVKMVDEYKVYSKRVFSSSSGSNTVRSLNSWSCPMPGCYKINTDAHVVEGVKTSLGVVIRDNQGKLLLIATKKDHVTSPEIAEAMAVRYGIQLALRFGFQRALIETDAINVVQGVKHCKAGFSPFFLVCNDIRADSLYLDYFELSHVRRSGNTFAHLVARRNTESSSELICMGLFPQSVSLGRN